MSDMLPGDISRMRGRPAASVSPWILLVRPPREVPMPCGKSPPFAPAAERWTVMLVESIATDPHTPLWPVNASKTSNQMPCRLQRWKRL